jgi:TRAP-type C4-dicarboxylate transport system substrate-binding protein
VLLDTGSDMVDYFGKILTGANAKAIETMKAKGIEVIELPAAERSELIKRGTNYVDAWIKTAKSTGLDGDALLAEYRSLLQKYTEQRDKQGYPWAK